MRSFFKVDGSNVVVQTLIVNGTVDPAEFTKLVTAGFIESTAFTAQPIAGFTHNPDHSFTPPVPAVVTPSPEDLAAKAIVKKGAAGLTSQDQANLLIYLGTKAGL